MKPLYDAAPVGMAFMFDANACRRFVAAQGRRLRRRRETAEVFQDRHKICCSSSAIVSAI